MGILEIIIDYDPYFARNIAIGIFYQTMRIIDIVILFISRKTNLQIVANIF